MTALHQTEAQFEQAVIQLARISGWKCAHFRAAQTAKGWRTPVSGDGAGYPDLTLCRPPELLFIELKAERGRASDAQREWLGALEACGAEVYVFRPSQWDQIQARLTAPRPTPMAVAA
jgi:hypothetical protein